ncbi:hypothetical protein [Kitasatospora sp. NPDC057223]|uniref:hypothetical protein n=1 Tax=Kitasatospora sp. NPDC057223 TaxID=3346055 RepID=UPI0036406929
MGIGYLLLYVALAVVALWLVAELLLQNRAPLHWRVVALGGFLGVVAGMAAGSVVVIGAGAVLFALGQVFVTLSVKRGHRDGWSLRKSDGALPGPLAKVPLLSAATGGEDVAEPVVVQHVGEVGEIEAEEVAVAAFESPAFETQAFETPGYGSTPVVEQTAAFEMQEIAADGVYADAPVYYEQQQQPAWDGGQQQWQPQQPGYGDQQQWQQPQHQQQPAYGYDQGYGGYQQQPGYGDQQQWQQQPQHQPTYEGYEQQQPAWDGGQQQWQQPQQPGQQQPVVPQQPVYDYQQGAWQQQQQ